MPHAPIVTTVVGSHPLPGWLEFCGQHPEAFGPRDREEMLDDAVTVAVMDQVRAGVDVVSDGEPARAQFNLSFYGFLEGVELRPQPPRRLGPPGHDQRPVHALVGELAAPRGLGVVGEFERLRRLAPPGTRLRMSVPGPYTLAGRLAPSSRYHDRHAVTEALVPIVRRELEALVEAGCEVVAVDEPSMSCYADREDQDWLVATFNHTIEPVAGRCRLGVHLCFGNYQGRAVARRRYAAMFPRFLDLAVDELHLEMAGREQAELELLAEVARVKDVGVGVIDVKNYYVETPDDVEARIRACLRHVPPERLSVSPDCGLSQMARWAAIAKLRSLVVGADRVRATL